MGTIEINDYVTINKVHFKIENIYWSDTIKIIYFLFINKKGVWEHNSRNIRADVDGFYFKFRKQKIYINGYVKDLL